MVTKAKKTNEIEMNLLQISWFQSLMYQKYLSFRGCNLQYLAKFLPLLLAEVILTFFFNPYSKVLFTNLHRSKEVKNRFKRSLSSSKILCNNLLFFILICKIKKIKCPTWKYHKSLPYKYCFVWKIFFVHLSVFRIMIICMNFLASL